MEFFLESWIGGRVPERKKTVTVGLFVLDAQEEGDRLAAGSDSGIVFVLRLGRPESAAEAPEAPEAALRHHSGAVRLVKWNRLGSADLLATTRIDGVKTPPPPPRLSFLHLEESWRVFFSLLTIWWHSFDFGSQSLSHEH